ncbi:MAG: protein phosphatase 2C domain-containing protein [Methanogenium sp.]|jgi:protein phosphatase
MDTGFAYKAISVTGRRPNNEDAWKVSHYSGVLFCAVADGIGGQPAGEVASSCAVQAAESVVSRAISTGSLPDYPTILIEAHVHADAMVKTEATGPRKGMGTTLTTALFSDDHLTACNTGDSRCSIVRDGKIIQITRDHSFVQEQIEAGIIRPDEGFSHPLNHIITRSIGAVFAADVTDTLLYPGDCIILSTDGMHDALTKERIVREVQGKTAREAATALLTAAAPVSDDNITVCVVTVSEKS